MTTNTINDDIPIPPSPSIIDMNVVQSPQDDLTSTRYFYLDNLRALAMLIGVLFHAALSHSVLLQEGWPTADTQNSFLVDIVCWILHTFRMPVFFLIAGFFAHYLVMKYGLSGFLKNRAKRILLPFVIFWPVMIVSIMGLLVYIAFHMPVDTPPINMIQFAIENPEAMQGQKPPISTTHLWFIYYLSIFCTISAIIYKYLPSLPNIQAALCSPLSLFIILPTVTGIALLFQPMPHPAPESFIPTFWAFVFFGLFFLVGWTLFTNQDTMNQLDRYLPHIAISGTLSAAIFISTLGPPLSFEELLQQLQNGVTLSTRYVICVAACAFSAWHLTLLSLIAARRFMDWKHSILRYVADASYWIYIIHVPLIFYFQAYFHTQELPIIIEFTLISTLTLGIGFISYALLVRHTPIGWLLHGRKKKRTLATSAV